MQSFSGSKDVKNIHNFLGTIIITVRVIACICTYLDGCFVVKQSSYILWFIPSSLQFTSHLRQGNYLSYRFLQDDCYTASIRLWETFLTNTCGHSGTPRFVVLAGGGFLALQAESRGTEELAAGVEVGAVWAFVSAVSRHVQLGTADLCTSTHHIMCVCYLHLIPFDNGLIKGVGAGGTCVYILVGVSSYPGRRNWRTSVCWPCTPPPSSGPHTPAYSGFYSASPSHCCGAVLMARCSSQNHVSHI